MSMRIGSAEVRSLALLFALVLSHLMCVHPGRIDLHNHYKPPFYLQWLTEKGFSGGPPTPWSPSLHLEYMERFGVEASVVSITTPGSRPSLNVSLDEARNMSRRLNEYAYHELVRKFPGRFQFWATVTLPDVEGSIEEAIYSLTVLKAAGIVLESNKFGVYLGDHVLNPFFQVLNDYGAVVFVHPNSPADVTTSVSGIPPSVVDFTLDTTRAALNLVITNNTQKYPNITYILASGGGTLPFTAYRMAFTSKYYSVQVMLEEFKKFYLDTAMISSPSAFPSILQFAHADRITFGSDFPFSVDLGLDLHTSTLDSFPLPPEDRVKINSSNALRVLLKGFE